MEVSSHLHAPAGLLPGKYVGRRTVLQCDLKEIGCDNVVWIPLVGPVEGSCEPSVSMKCGETLN